MRGVRRQARGGFGGCSTLGDGGLHGPPYRSVFASAAKTTPSYSLGCFGAPQERANVLDAKSVTLPFLIVKYVPGAEAATPHLAADDRRADYTTMLGQMNRFGIEPRPFLPKKGGP